MDLQKLRKKSEKGTCSTKASGNENASGLLINRRGKGSTFICTNEGLLRLKQE